MFHPRRRAGWTLLELLVLLAILAVLLAVLLPALRRARMTADRNQCANNLKQLGLACHSYQGTYNVLPPGALGPLREDNVPGTDAATGLNVLAGAGQNIGLMVFLLPFLEEDDLCKKLVDPVSGGAFVFSLDSTGSSPQKGDPATGEGPNNWLAATSSGQSNYTLSTRQIQAFLCPAAQVDPNALDGVVTFTWFLIGDPTPAQMPYTMVYQARGPTYGTLPFDAVHNPACGLTNYLGVAGARGNNVRYPDPVWDTYAGLFDNRTTTSLQRVKDGTSQTMLLGEATGKMRAGAITEGFSWMGAGVQSTRWGLGGPTECGIEQFGSRHPNIVNFCYADCSVHGLMRVVDPTAFASVVGQTPVPLPSQTFVAWHVLQQLAGYQDGETPFQSLLLP